MKKFLSIVALTALALVTGCDQNQVADKVSTPAPSITSMTILAGSELKDMEPLLEQAQKSLGIKLSIKYTGTIEGVEQIKDGGKYDLGWLSQSKYFYDTAEGSKRIKLSEKTMLSPVVIGVRKASYDKLALPANAKPSWTDVYGWVTQKGMTYAMTDPSESNTGYIGLMGVAYSITAKGENLKANDVDKNKMSAFFKGHIINAGSSGFLAEPFSKSKVDFMINYEASVLQYNKTHPSDQLVIVYPYEGIMTADYPMILLDGNKVAVYQKLVEFLKSESSQKWIMDNTSRRSLNRTAMLAQKAFPEQMLIEMPFSPAPELSEQLLASYYKDFKKPSVLAFVLDTSGSMNEGTREKDMKGAISNLTVNVANNSRFAKLREREKVYVVPFSSQAYGVKMFDMGQTEEQAQLGRKQVNNYVSGLQMKGGTALFSSTYQAVILLKDEVKKNPENRYSVVVFTDGISNEGMTAEEFVQEVKKAGIESGQVRVYPVLFGEGDKSQLDLIANSTGGRVFDGRTQALSAVFKQIRSFQ